VTRTGKYTPGPWKARKAGELTVEGSATKFPNHVVYEYKDNLGRRCTAFVAHCDSATLENEANARLIAAAPELLEALKECLPQIRWASIHGSRCDELIAEVEAAIRKATEGE
jgi:hypothetical protein